MESHPDYEGQSLDPNLFPVWETPVRTTDVGFELAIMEAVEAAQSGDTAEARIKLQHSREHLPRGRPNRVSSCLHKLAKAYWNLGELSAAYMAAKESLVALRPMLAPPSLEEAKNQLLFNRGRTSRSQFWVPQLYTFGVLCHEHGQDDLACEAIEIARESLGAHNELRLYSAALNDIGLFSSHTGHFDLADAYLCESRRLKAVVGDNRRPVTWSGVLKNKKYGLELRPDGNLEDFRSLSLKGIPDDIWIGLVKHGQFPSRVGPARLLLEIALIHQYREIAHGIFVDRLLRREDIPSLEWWFHYCCMIRGSAHIRPNLKEEGFRLFQRRTVQDVAMRRVRPIRPDDLYRQEVVIYGGRVRCWEEGRINRQLAALGSSLRLLIVDSDRARERRLYEQYVASETDLHNGPHPLPLDGRFILGRIGPWSAFRHASVFDFREELVVAPQIAVDVSGFAEQNRAVCRSRRDVHEKTETSPRDWWEFLRYDTLMHEYGHIETDLEGNGLFGTLSSWRDCIREDICRLATNACTPAHLARVFGWIYRTEIDIDEDADNNCLWDLQTSDVKIDEFPSLQEDVEELSDCGLLKVDRDDRLYCPMFQDNAPCQPSVA